MRSFTFFNPHQIFCSGHQIEKNVMGGACSTLRGEGRCIQVFGEEI
jgi:hypothetical protein